MNLQLMPAAQPGSDWALRELPHPSSGQLPPAYCLWETCMHPRHVNTEWTSPPSSHQVIILQAPSKDLCPPENQSAAIPHILNHGSSAACYQAAHASSRLHRSS